MWNGSLQQGDVQCVQSTDLKKDQWFRDVWNGSLQQGDVQCVQSTDLKKISGSETCGMIVLNRVTCNVFRDVWNVILNMVTCSVFGDVLNVYLERRGL